MRPSVWAIVVLIIVVLLLFGANKLPEIAGSIGRSMKIFKREVKELREDDAPGAPAGGTTTTGTTGTASTRATTDDGPPGGTRTPPSG